MADKLPCHNTVVRKLLAAITEATIYGADDQYTLVKAHLEVLEESGMPAQDARDIAEQLILLPRQMREQCREGMAELAERVLADLNARTDETQDLEICDCLCHVNHAIHMMPCCDPCPHCQKNIRVGQYDQHIARCRAKNAQQGETA